MMLGCISIVSVKICVKVRSINSIEGFDWVNTPMMTQDVLC